MDQRADEFLNEWNQWIEQGKPIPDMNYLKDRNRKMIFLFLKKLKETGDKKYIPYLIRWEKIDYKKVKAEIRETINVINSELPFEQKDSIERKAAIQEALEGRGPQDILIKCWECGDRFTFTVGEQQFYKQRGFADPKRCEECRRNHIIF